MEEDKEGEGSREGGRDRGEGSRGEVGKGTDEPTSPFGNLSSRKLQS